MVIEVYLEIVLHNFANFLFFMDFWYAFITNSKHNIMTQNEYEHNSSYLNYILHSLKYCLL